MSNTKFWKPNMASNFKVGLGKSKDGGKGKSRKKIFKNLGKKYGKTLVVGGVILLIVFILLIRPSFALFSKINELKKDFSALKQSFTNRDLLAFEKSLSDVDNDLNELRKLRVQKYGWAKKFPLIKNYYSDSEHFINAGLYGVAAGREFVTIITPFADAVGLKVTEEQEVEQKGFAEAFATWIAVMPKVADDLDGVIVELSKVGDELSDVNAKRYPGSIGRTNLRGSIRTAQVTLSKLNDYAPDLKEALKVVPNLLGVGTGEQRYMIIFQNDAEIRATGGFWTYYSTFKIKDALLASDFTSKDMYSIDHTLDVIDPYHTFPLVPAAYAKYLKVERMYARDANISPDFPTAIEQFEYFYDMAINIAPYEIKPVGGFIAIDTNVISELLGITGAVTVNGITYTEENVVLELEKIASLSLSEQINRKKVLGDLMEAMLVNVFESDKNLWPKLIEKSIDLANRKHVFAYMRNPDAQLLLEKYNFAGRIIDPVEGDFAFFVSTNLGGDKTNMFVPRGYEHELTKMENGKWMRTVKIHYAYDQPPAEYAALAKRFRDWFRLYVPEGAELISIEGSSDSFENGNERGKVYFAGYMELGPGESHDVTIKYYLPDGIVDGATYNLYIEKQAGTDLEVHKIVTAKKTETLELDKDYQYNVSLE